MELQLSIHEHPLRYYEHEKNGVLCYGCLQPLSGVTYYCKHCDFTIHKSCGELPSQIIHFLHPKHPLTLLIQTQFNQRRVCDYCDEMIWGFIYHCSLCKYALDVKCVLLREIVKHEGHQLSIQDHQLSIQDHQLSIQDHKLSIHKHPLMFYEHEKKGDSRVNCYGCLQPLSGATYDCQTCDFIIHKSCGELPSQIIHFLHPKHPLTLFSQSPYGGGHPICDYCDEMIWGFIYHCSLCGYDLDLKCVLLREIVKHEGHQHSFTLLRPLSFTCDDCGETSEKKMSYLCTTCQLLLHKDCASLRQSSNPTENKSDDFASRDEDDFASSDEDDFSSSDEDDFASSDEDVIVSRDEDVIVSRDEDDIDPITIGVDMLPEIQHSSHPHSLTLKNDEPLPDEICDACVRPISAPFYKCDPCNFLLHLSCVRLQTTITSLLHPHPLSLTCNKDPLRFFKCQACEQTCSGFAYVCKLCEYSISIDIRCASISKTTLKHGGHEHILTLDQKMYPSNCSACGSSCYTKFRCEDCDFNLDLRCAMLPLNARHRWDEKHPLKLTFRNFERIPGQYFCNICEDERDPRYWYYSCLECDLEVHPSCLFGEHDIKFGATVEDEKHHEHKLTFLKRSRFYARCKTSCDPDKKDLFVFECLSCNYHFHVGIHKDKLRKLLSLSKKELWFAREILGKFGKK